MTHRWKITALSLAAALAACSPQDAPMATTAQPADASLLSVPFPSAYLSGYARDVRGEILNYHSPVPTIRTSLLVRSEDRGRSIAWESQPIPEGLEGDDATFIFMLGIDVNEAPRRFDFQVNGRDIFQIANPTEAAMGDTIVWEGAGGVRGEFIVTLIDRYSDAMGFLFLTLPRNLWEPGRPLQIQVQGESAGARTWFMVFRDPLEPHLRIQNAPAVLRTEDGGEAQVIRLDLLTLTESQRFVLESPVGVVDSVVTRGHARFTLPVPAVADPEEVTLQVALGDYETRVPYTVTPPRRMEVHLHHHTHVDIGYTHHQDEVERLQWSHLEEALRLAEESRDYPDGARFIWIPEGIWPVDSYLRAHPGEKTEKLLEGIRKGWIELDGMYAGLLTGLANEETLLRAFDAGSRLSRMSGVPIESEMLSDIPGFSWGLVEAMARNGLKYLSIGPNFGHRIGHFTKELGDRPFYWEGPSGRSRILTWVSGGGYAWFHTGLGFDSITAVLNDEEIFRYVDQLVAAGYPYDLSYLRYNIGSDNGPPDPTLAGAVRDWNRRYASPVLRISSMTETFREFETRYGDELPTYRGDMTGHWEDGAAPSARETAMTRRTAESLVQTENLARMLGVTLDPDSLEGAWRNVLLFYEHTWGSWNSISEPYSELTLTSWERKKAFAETAAEQARRLREEALLPEAPGQGAAPSSAIAAGTSPRPLEVINTLPWPRSDLVVLSKEASSAGDRVMGPDGQSVPSQRLGTGELAFLARDVPALGHREYRVEAGEAPTFVPFKDDESPASRPSAGQGETGASGGLRISTAHYTLGIDEATAAITSLRHRATGRELVDAGTGPFNQYIYIPGRDPARAIPQGTGAVRLVDAGPLVWTVEITTPGEGLREPVLTRVRLIRGLDRVELSNRISKEWILDPEAVLFRFPFAVENPRVRIDAPFGSFRPEADQTPGASKNYLSVQRWVDISSSSGSDATGGITLTTLDAPLIQLGEIRTDPIVYGWLEEIQPSATLYSYVMNNYWETNYRAAQDDEVTFRYRFRAHGQFQEEDAERFALEEARPLLVRATGSGG